MERALWQVRKQATIAASRKKEIKLPIVARFEIDYRQFLDAEGRVLQPLPRFAQDPLQLTSLYRHMVLARSFDQKMLALQRTGQLGTFASSVGKEAVDVGVASAMRPEDALLVTYRETAAQLLRGVSMLELLLYWGGDERGSDFANARGDFPICITIASHCCHAVGAAYAFKLRREQRVAVCMIGDGATSKGEFYESINGAGMWHLPVVFVITNNQWAISVPRKTQSAAATLAQKAVAAGIPGIQVDGNDLIAVRQAAEEAIERARCGDGPSLIEAQSYRLSDHTTADDASRYRSADELAEAWNREPLGRLRNYLIASGAWSRHQEELLHKSCAEQVQRAAEAYLAFAAPGASQMFDCLHASLPAAYAQQRDAAVVEQKNHGTSHTG
jgi:2-oxoisovalerate dehydrogenase E1 component alpha subunit